MTADYGRGFSRSNLFRMIRFAEVFPDPQIVADTVRQLGWSHFIEIIPFDDPLKRDFYAEMCRIERWSVRTLRSRIDGMLFERTAIAKKPEEIVRRELDALRREDRLTPDLVFRDPYVLDFLRLEGAYGESDMEAAILRDLEAFLLELGGDFSFVARQKRITVDNEDYYLDLLFFHRGSAGWWRWNSSSASFGRPTRDRWNCTCGGWRSTRRVRARRRPSASSSARKSPKGTWNCWNWKRAASAWPST